MKNRVGRIIIGLLALALLGFYTYKQEQIHWHSADVEAWGPATGLHPEGFEAGTLMQAAPEEPAEAELILPEPADSPAPAATPDPAPTSAPAPTFAPAPVLTDARYDGESVEISWTAFEGAENYRVFRKTDDSGWENVGDSLGTSFTDRTVLPDTTYIYTVRCVSADGSAYTSDYDKQGIRVTTSADQIVQAEPKQTAYNGSELSPSVRLAYDNAAARGLPTPPAVDIDSWELMLANAAHPIGEYKPEVMGYLNMTASETDIQTDYNANRCPVDYRIAEALLAFALGCKEAGLPVYLSSGYRSYDEQSYLFQRKVGQVGSEDVAATIVARPGTSEHQTGLACDITDYYHETKDSSLESTPTYQWLSEHCTEYGFVVRYPANKSGSADSVTGIIYEPWHFRYVGVEAARYMTENDLCLEEFLALYGLE